MPPSRLEHLDRAVLLAVWSKRPKPPSILELRNDLLLCVPSFGKLVAERAVDAAIARAIKSGRVERVPPASSREAERFALTETGGRDLEDAFGALAHDTWKRTYPKVLGAETVAAVRDRAVDFDFLRAFVLARALGLDERVLHAKTATDVLNIVAAATVKAPNAEPETIRDVLVRRWIADGATVETYASDDDADFLSPSPVAPAAKPSRAKKAKTATAPAPNADAAATPKRGSKATSLAEPKSPPKARAKKAAGAAAPRKRTTTAAPAAPEPRIESPAAPPSLEAFADAVRDAAKAADGRVGRRAFISRVWAAFQREGRADGMSVETFKALLVQANRRQLVSLSRADLPQSFAAGDIRDSAVGVLGDDVHFITVEDDR